MLNDFLGAFTISTGVLFLLYAGFLAGLVIRGQFMNRISSQGKQVKESPAVADVKRRYIDILRRLHRFQSAHIVEGSFNDAIIEKDEVERYVAEFYDRLGTASVRDMRREVSRIEKVMDSLEAKMVLTPM